MSVDERYEYVDALRGWAILGVLLVHVWIWIGAENDFLSRLSFNGAMGVQLFYLISAFTLLLSIDRRRQQGLLHWRSYFIRRFFRVAPLFYVAMLIYGPMWQFVPRYWMPEGIQAWHILTSLTFTHGWHPKSVNGIVPGGWSMAVEMTFYLLFPLFYFWISSLGRSLIFVMISLLVGMAVSDWVYELYIDEIPQRFSYVLKNFAYAFIPSAQICVFALGFVAFYLFKYRFFESPSKIKGTGFIVLGLLLSGVFLYWLPPLLPPFFVFALGFVVLLTGLRFYPLGLLVNPVINAIGKLSYSLYLTHFGVIFIFKTYLADCFKVFNKDTALLLAFISVVIVSTLVSIISYRLIEVPGMKFAKKLTHKS